MTILSGIETLIRSNLRARTFIPLLLLALATTWYGLFYSVDRFATLTDGLSFMDMQPLLTAESLFIQIRAYSAETISFYLGWSLFDYAWPLLTFTTMLFISAWLTDRLPGGTRLRFPWFIASAYLTVLMDWIENAGFVALVTGLPAEPLWLARLTLGFHALKLLSNLVFNLLFWVLLGSVIITVVRQRLSRVSGN